MSLNVHIIIHTLHLIIIHYDYFRHHVTLCWSTTVTTWLMDPNYNARKIGSKHQLTVQTLISTWLVILPDSAGARECADLVDTRASRRTGTANAFIQFCKAPFSTHNLITFVSSRTYYTRWSDQEIGNSSADNNTPEQESLRWNGHVTRTGRDDIHMTRTVLDMVVEVGRPSGRPQLWYMDITRRDWPYQE